MQSLIIIEQILEYGQLCGAHSVKLLSWVPAGTWHWDKSLGYTVLVLFEIFRKQ